MRGSRLFSGLLKNIGLAAGLALPLFGHDPITTNLTWTKEISRIVFKHCAQCHTYKGSAMPLMTWEQARPWAKAIRDEVANRRMPPWGPVAGIGSFKGDRSLSTPEIEMLVTWVEGGAPEGDPAYLPARIVKQPLPAHTPFSSTLILNQELKLTLPLTIVGIKPTAAIDAWAEEPDGTVTRLIRIVQMSTHSPGTFFYEDALSFPAGTKLHTTSKATVYLRR